MADVIAFGDHQPFDPPGSPMRTLRMAHQARPREVLVVGVYDDGEVFVAGCPNDPGNALWLMERAKQRLLNPSEKVFV